LCSWLEVPAFSCVPPLLSESAQYEKADISIKRKADILKKLRHACPGALTPDSQKGIMSPNTQPFLLMSTGLVLVVSAPSGAGKSTLCQALGERQRGLTLSVSCTTRPPRASEKSGVDYFFLSKSDFEGRAARGEFLEWARVHGHAYGTPRAPVEKALREGRVIVLNVDVQGAAAVRVAFPRESVLAFIAPPSWKTLEDRLRGRDQDAEEVIQHRLANARGELAQASRYDYLVINHDVGEAVDDLAAIVRAEHRRISRAAEDLARLGGAPPTV